MANLPNQNTKQSQYATESWRNRFDSPFRDFDRWFNEWSGLPARLRTEISNPVLNPNCEISETKTHYIAKFDLPGLSKDQIKIDLHDNVLTVSGE